MVALYNSLGFHEGHVPIGILTCNRPALLDLTLRSLSASILPEGVRVILYDDASNALSAIDYLYSTNAVGVASSLMPGALIADMPKVTLGKDIRGIYGRFQIVRTNSHIGAFHASILALHHLLKTSGASYLCLVQDDVIFTKDWYLRMSEVAVRQRPGVLAGVAFGSAACQKCEMIERGAVKSSFVQASCLFLNRELLISVLPTMSAIEKSRMWGFDTLMCDIACQTSARILLMCPNVCQHVGELSLVRPGRSYDRKGGRYSHCVRDSLAFGI